MVIKVYRPVKTHWGVYLRSLYFITCKLYLTKYDWNKAEAYNIKTSSKKENRPTLILLKKKGENILEEYAQ